MELVYADAKTEEQCTSLKAAKRLFGGNDALARSLMFLVISMRYRRMCGLLR